MPLGNLGLKSSWILFLLRTSSRNPGSKSLCQLGHVPVPEHCNHCGRKRNECTDWLKPSYGVPSGTEVQHHPNQVDRERKISCRKKSGSYFQKEEDRLLEGLKHQVTTPASHTQLSPPTCLSHCSPSLPFPPFSSAHKPLSIPLKTWFFLS